MTSVARALARAIPLLVDRRVVMLVLLPLLAGAILWTVLLLAAWSPIQHGVASLIAAWLGAVGLASALEGVADFAAGLLAFVLVTLSAGALVLAAIAVLAGPVFVRVVEARWYPALERRRGGTIAGSLGNAIVTLLLLVPMWLVVLPLLLFPVVGVPASLLLSAWFNQRLFRYDALAEHASPEEIRTIVRRERWRLIGLGLVLSPLAFVPFVNLLMPIYAGLAFTCFCLDAVAALRPSSAKDVR